jgi:nicotinate-nucleotide adenylyltransferase
MKIAIFGGSFNPPTAAHMRLANHLVEHSIVDRVLMMPCYKSLYNKGLESGMHRINMICGASHHPRVKAFDWEIKNKIDGPGTYQIMTMLEEEFPFDELYFVIGLDNSQKVKSWKCGNKIVRSMRFIVIPRMGVDVTDEWFKKKPHIFLDTYEADDISSTKVKQLLKEGSDTTQCLDKSVKEYILRHNLYKDT